MVRRAALFPTGRGLGSRLGTFLAHIENLMPARERFSGEQVFEAVSAALEKVRRQGFEPTTKGYRDVERTRATTLRSLQMLGSAHWGSDISGLLDHPRSPRQPGDRRRQLCGKMRFYREIRKKSMPFSSGKRMK